MKKLLIILLILFVPVLISAQNVTGQWNGKLKIQEGMTLRIIFHIEETAEGYSATLDSPDQNANGIPVTSVKFTDPELNIKMDNLRATYSGKLEGGAINGTFTQAGQSFPLNLSREAIEKEVINRPQEPKLPYPYLEEEVTFSGGAENVTLAGTLTLPKVEGKHPVVILISGSGPQDRNEELLNHKPFLVLADYLTRNGIGVLRYDDRGTHESTGNFGIATSLDFADDVLAAVAYLKTREEVDTKKIGLVGHSEGGLIAPVAAVKSEEIDFIVLLAGPGVSGREILLQQTRKISEVSGIPEEEIERDLEISENVFDIMENQENGEELEVDLREYLDEAIPEEGYRGVSKEDIIDIQVSTMSQPWFRYFVIHEPAEFLSKVKCPVLAVNGELDVQVIPENLSQIEEALKTGGNTSYTIYEFQGMNHLFQEAETGSTSEYASIEETFSPIALEYITAWIRDVTDLK